MAELSTGISSRYGNRSKTPAHIIETGWYKPVPSYGTTAEIQKRQPTAVSISNKPPRADILPEPAVKPSDISLLDISPQKSNTETASPVAPPAPEAEILYPSVLQEPGHSIGENQNEPSQSALDPPLSVRSYTRPKAEDNFSRFLSAQVCAAILLFAAACVFKLTAEPAFTQMQEKLRKCLSDMGAVYSVSEQLHQVGEKGIQEVLREALSKGLEEDSARLSQGQTIVLYSSALLQADNPSGRQEPAGGAENPSDGTAQTVSQAVAAGGSYSVSMEQIPYALAVAQDGRRSAAAAVRPTEGTLTCEYGPREHPITGNPDFHTGIDIGAPLGTSIYAAAAGVVEKTGTSKSLGNYLMLRHSSSTVTTYSHCSQIIAEEGEAVACGQVIALVGSSGVSTGPHLHFECIVDDTLTDPAWILDLPLPAG